jgi:hypothetical protein
VVQIVVGGVVYVIGAFLFCRPGAQEVVRLAKATLQRRRRG